MTQLHAIGHMVALVVATGYAVLGLAIAIFEKVPRHAQLASLITLAAVVFTGSVGVVSAVIGSGPREGIHWVYGAAMVLGALASIGFGATMNPRPRGLVMLATGTFLLLLAFRLAETG